MSMEGFSTKQKGDVAEHRVITECLRRGMNVLRPIGDRLQYDLAVERSGHLVRIQVKCAWPAQGPRAGSHLVDIRRGNVRRGRATPEYTLESFEVLIAWLPDLDVFYVFPIAFVCAVGSSITMKEVVPADAPGPKPRSPIYREAWHLIEGPPPPGAQTCTARSSGL